MPNIMKIRTMLSRVTAKNVGDIFLRHTVYRTLCARCYLACRSGVWWWCLRALPIVCGGTVCYVQLTPATSVTSPASWRHHNVLLM